MEIAPLNRTLEQELNALLRGASMECLVCGEFVRRDGHRLACGECASVLAAEGDSAGAQLQFETQAG
jgi:Zn finger protein HypA/HybF involved in hydrogenase expression